MTRLNIVKIGGAIVNDEQALDAFLQEFVKLDYPKIVIHGGGNAASDLCERLGIAVRMKDGRRITDKDSLDVAVMVYAGLINKNIVAKLQSRACNALGLSGADLNTIPATKRNHPTIDFGYVGDVTADAIHTYFVSRLLDERIVPVFPAITHDTKGQLLNTNADTIASTLAIAFSEKYNVSLTYCFEKPGVLNDIHDDDSWIRKLTESEFNTLKSNGTIHEGMIPKLDNAFEALSNSVDRVQIKHAENLSNEIGTELEL